MLQAREPPPIEQALPLWLSIDHSRPGFAGSGSLTMTPCAVAAPLLLTTIVKPICSPAETGERSAVFVMLICAASTSTWAVASSLPSFVVVTNAVLMTVWPPVAPVVGDVMWIV